LFSNASHNSRLTPVEPLAGSTDVITRVSELIADLKSDDVDMLKGLHRIQHEFGFVPPEAIPLLAGQFRTTPAIVYGTIDFYSEIRTVPPAETTVDWCSGPACLLKGSMNIRNALEAILECKMNRSSPDGRFGLRLVQCDGTCHLAPLVRHDGRYIGPLTVSDAIEWARGLKDEETGPAGETVAAGTAVEEHPTSSSPAHSHERAPRE
jgi:NADH:ubiquinone oxidoreductase subunit E